MIFLCWRSSRCFASENTPLNHSCSVLLEDVVGFLFFSSIQYVTASVGSKSFKGFMFTLIYKWLNNVWGDEDSRSVSLILLYMSVRKTAMNIDIFCQLFKILLINLSTSAECGLAAATLAKAVLSTLNFPGANNSNFCNISSGPSMSYSFSKLKADA